MPKRILTVIDPAAAPVRGLTTERDSLRIPPGAGFFKELRNLRWAEDDVLRVRKGTTALSAPITAGASVSGLASFTFNGTSGVLVLGLKDNATHETAVYMSTDGVAWSEITAVTGQYGSTRLEADASGNDHGLAVAVVHDRFSGKDCLLLQNGVAAPRVYDGQTTAVHRGIDPPTKSNLWGAIFRLGSAPDGGLDIDNPANTAYTNSGPQLTLADQSSGADNVARLTIGTSVALNDSAEIRDTSVSARLNLANSRQLVCIVKTTYRDWIHRLKIEVGTTAGVYGTVYEPNQPQFAAPVVIPIEGVASSYLVAFGVDHLTNDPSFGPQTINLHRVRLSWKSASPPSAAQTVDFYGIMAGGKVPGGASYAVSFYNSGSRAESYEQVLASRPERLSNLYGMPDAGGPLDLNATLPLSEEIFYEVLLVYANTSAADRDSGVDSLRVYRKDPGEDVHTYCATAPLATYFAGVWSFSGGTAMGVTVRTEATPPEDKLPWLASPGAFQIATPIARAMVAANGRLIALARAESVDAFPRVACSMAGFPFRFSQTTQLEDPSTATEEELPGENGLALATTAGSFLGSATVYAFTDRSIYQINTDAVAVRGFLTHVASVGVVGPNALVEDGGRVFFVDPDMRVLLLSGDGIRPLSPGAVQNRLDAIPVARRRALRAVYYRSRLYLAYAPAGGTANTRILLWSDLASGGRGAWESEDVLPGPCSADGFVVHRPGDPAVTGGFGQIGEARMLLVGVNAVCYRYEHGASDLGGDVEVCLRTGEFRSPERSLTFGRIENLSDAMPGKLVSVTRIYKPHGGLGVSALSLSSASPYAWSHDGPPTATGLGLGAAASLEIAGNLTPGKVLSYGLRIEVDSRDGGARG